MSFVGFNNLELEAAKVASHDPSFKAQAQKAKQAVEAEASRMYSKVSSEATGRFMTSIDAETTVTRGGVHDIEVYSDDPGALSIEFGYMRKDGRWEPGKFVFSRALMRLRFGG